MRNGSTSNSSRGGSTPLASGMFATLYPWNERYIDSGVFEVRETPMRTMSALARSSGLRPSSWETKNSIASMRLK